MRFAIATLTVTLAIAQVPFERIRDAATKEPGSWLTYSGNLQGHRHSPLTELTPANVANLRVKWAYQVRDGRGQTSPLVADGVMYVTSPHRVAALDLRTGRELWVWERPIPRDYQSIGFGRVNRGPAILDDKLYVATLDCYLIALDLKSGQERWSVKVEDYKPGYSMTLAPPSHQGESARRRERRRSGNPRIRRCVRLRHRETGVALPHHSAAA